MSDLLGKLEGFFNQDPKREEDYRDFERRAREDPNSISDEEAARRYREMMANLDDNDPDTETESERAFDKLSPEDRRKLAQHYREATNDSSRPFQGYSKDVNEDQATSPRELSRMTREAARNDPDLLESLFGKNSPLSSTAGKAALAGVAALAARKFLSKR